MKICVMGLGYIGLPTASLLATKGFLVHGVDVQKKVVDQLNEGKIHIVEPDLDILVKSAVLSQKFKASLQPEKADIFIITVPTPFQSDKTPDLTYVEAAAKSIAPYLCDGNLVILESTSPVGTTEHIREILLKLRTDLKKIYFAYCPERVIPGKILQELISNDRVVGGLDTESSEKASAFYRSFVQGKILVTDVRTAEMCKLAENAFRDVNIAFANELSLICDQLKINVWELIRLANHHPRVNILQPGSGVGGHCIAVDPWFIVAKSPEISKLIRTAREVNDYKPHWVVDQVKQATKNFAHPVVACLGVTFKADIDDLRESPALEIVRALSHEKIAEVLVCEPHVQKLENFTLVTLETALERADIVLILVDHQAFKKIRGRDLSKKKIIDTKGLLA